MTTGALGDSFWSAMVAPASPLMIFCAMHNSTEERHQNNPGKARVTKENPTPPDFDALAKRYLDLWQEQIAKLAKDPGKLSDASTAWSQMAASVLKGAPSNPFTATAHDASAFASASRSAPPSAAPGAGGMDSLELLRRLDDIERRLAALESRPATESKPGKRSRAPRGGPSGGAKP